MFQEINSKLPDHLLGDQIHLKQVLVNLTKNALKFSQGKQIKIRAKYEYSRQVLRVYVVDKGRGIRKEEMDKLFKLFGKIKRTEKDNTDGIGMGLKICQKILSHNGGVIDAFSEGANLGSTFMFTMPMTLPDDDGMIVEEEKDEATAHWHSMSIGEILD